MIIQIILYFVCKEIRWFFSTLMIWCSFIISHAIYTAVSVWSIINRYNVISSQTNHRHTYCVKSKRLLFMVFRHLKKASFFKETIMLSWKFLRPITLVRASMFLVQFLKGTIFCSVMFCRRKCYNIWYFPYLICFLFGFIIIFPYEKDRRKENFVSHI